MSPRAAILIALLAAVLATVAMCGLYLIAGTRAMWLGLLGCICSSVSAVVAYGVTEPPEAERGNGP